jgi:hypothetical protein
MPTIFCHDDVISKPEPGLQHFRSNTALFDVDGSHILRLGTAFMTLLYYIHRLADDNEFSCGNMLRSELPAVTIETSTVLYQ